jgi:hypothetical protein
MGVLDAALAVCGSTDRAQGLDPAKLEEVVDMLSIPISARELEGIETLPIPPSWFRVRLKC